MSNIMHDQTIPATTCPDWCQSKPHDNPDGSYDGPHTIAAVPALDGLGGDHSALVSVDLDDGHGAVIFLGAPNLSMTTEQAHSAAQALLLAATWAQDPSAVARPGWATETREPQKPGDFGMHWTTVRVGAAVIRVEQIYDFVGGEYTPEPVLANLTDTKDIYGMGSTVCDAQWCRDLAAALLEAAQIIDNA